MQETASATRSGFADKFFNTVTNPSRCSLQGSKTHCPTKKQDSAISVLEYG